MVVVQYQSMAIRRAGGEEEDVTTRHLYVPRVNRDPRTH